MTTVRQQRFVAGTMGWALGGALVLALLDALEYQLFFVTALVGFLVVVELTKPLNIAPEWRTRLKWLIALGMAIFAYIVVDRILEIMPSGVL